MIDISIIRDFNNKINSIQINGHSGYAEEGFDIVCSAVSALTISTINGLTDIVGIDDLKTSVDYGNTLIDLSENRQKQSEVDLLTETLVLGLKSIKESYPEFISIQEYTEDKEM